MNLVIRKHMTYSKPFHMQFYIATVKFLVDLSTIVILILKPSKYKGTTDISTQWERPDKPKLNFSFNIDLR
jgi:hypothetical protein